MYTYSKTFKGELHKVRNRLDMEKVEQAPEALHKVVSSIFIFDQSMPVLMLQLLNVPFLW